MSAWIAAQLSPQAPGFWLTVGLLTTALLLSSEQLMAQLWRSRLWVALWLLIPYLGLLAGGLSPRLMGLAGIDWPLSLGLGLGICFAVVLLLAVVRAVLEMGDRIAGGASLPPPRLMGSIILWSGVTQFHWSFLRGGIWEVLLTLPQPPALPGYWAVWSAAALVVLQLLWARPGFPVLLVQLATLATTSILFFYTRNFWLCWLLHAAVQVVAAPALSPALLPGRQEATR